MGLRRAVAIACTTAAFAVSYVLGACSKDCKNSDCYWFVHPTQGVQVRTSSETLVKPGVAFKRTTHCNIANLYSINPDGGTCQKLPGQTIYVYRTTGTRECILSFNPPSHATDWGVPTQADYLYPVVRYVCVADEPSS